MSGYSLTIECDVCGARGEFLAVGWTAAWQQAREAGWVRTSARHDGEGRDLCATCARAALSAHTPEEPDDD